MTNKEIIYKKIKELNSSEGIDTSSLSSALNISRANVSHELNTLVKEGKILKSNTRPVLFFLNEPQENDVKKTKLDQLLAHNISLRQAIEQAKAAILYPPDGMNCLILGPTGVGKSMFAGLMHDYAVNMNAKLSDSPFIVFNCADYSNNPQLLTSQLFGVKKGAYTGCESDKEGLLEQADGGILFLDEIHRLPPEGQEALFVFLDTGHFRRMGDSTLRSANVLIIAATTENPDSVLLATFLRRIPITIKIPSLKERTFEERLYIIKSFLKQESLRIGKPINVSMNSLRALISYDCPNNIGGLKSDTQLLCARAYSEFLTTGRKSIEIRSRMLPEYIKAGLYKDKETRILWNRLIGTQSEFFKFSGSDTSEDDYIKGKENHIYSFLEQKLKTLKSNSESNVEDILEKDISKYFEKHIEGVSEEINLKNLKAIVEPDILESFEEIIKYLENNYNIHLHDNVYIAFALHLNTLINRIYNNKPIVNTHLDEIKTSYKKEFDIALKIKSLLEDRFGFNIPDDEAGFIALFLTPENPILDTSKDKVKVILIAHGLSTASSMADVANQLLSEDYVISIDAPLSEKPAEILNKLRNIIKDNPTSKGYLLLVDMGSLTTFGSILEKELDVSIKVIPLASTLHILEAARKALQGVDLNDLYNDVMMVNSYVETPKTVTLKKYVIITACLTGEGGAVAMKSFLNSTLRYDKNVIEIINLNCLDRKYFIEKIKSIQVKHEILFIVAPYKLKEISIKQYGMNEILNADVSSGLQNLIDIKTSLNNIPNIINENLKDIDGKTAVDDTLQLINLVKNSLDIQLKDEAVIGIILHISFVIHRLKNKEPLNNFPDKEEFISKHSEMYNCIKENFSFINQKYNIQPSMDELCYIVKLFAKD